MKKIFFIALCLMTALGQAQQKKSASAAKSFQGTWCTGEDGMVLTFSGKDSLRVTSTSDQTVGGTGKYTRTDTTLSATIVNGEMALKMEYRYRWKGADTVEAKATLFTINDEAVANPEEWMSMVRCTEK